MESLETLTGEIEKKAIEISDHASDIIEQSKGVSEAATDIEFSGPKDSDLVSLRAGIRRIESAYCGIQELVDELDCLEAKIEEIRQERNADVETTGAKVSDQVECR